MTLLSPLLSRLRSFRFADRESEAALATAYDWCKRQQSPATERFRPLAICIYGPPESGKTRLTKLLCGGETPVYELRDKKFDWVIEALERERPPFVTLEKMPSHKQGARPWSSPALEAFLARPPQPGQRPPLVFLHTDRPAAENMSTDLRRRCLFIELKSR